MSLPGTETAILLTLDCLERIDAKTAHGLIRGPSRFPIVGVVDRAAAGGDAGQLVDGRARGIPVAASVESLLATLERRPDHCIIGVATKGGMIPPDLRTDLVQAAHAGMTLINGLHQALSDDADLARIVDGNGGRILDIRKPRDLDTLRFWTGEVLDLSTPRVAVLGTDCALGKRTTCNLLEQALARYGVKASVVYTGQTGWLQGRQHGFIFDATPNDFVPGELERAILDCDRAERPDLMLLEGQSGLRNPSGPCGSEFIVSGGASAVLLQHAPVRRYYKGFEKRGAEIPPLIDEIGLIRSFGAEVWAVGLHEEGLDSGAAEREARRIEDETGVPVTRPLNDGAERMAGLVRDRLGPASGGATT